MFTLPSLHKPDRYDEAIKEVLDAGITLKTRRHLTADFVGTSKPMSKDEFHEFLQKRIASYEESIQSIDEFLDRQASHDNIEASFEQSLGGLDPILVILTYLLKALTKIKVYCWKRAQKRDLEVKQDQAKEWIQKAARAKPWERGILDHSVVSSSIVVSNIVLVQL